MFLFVSLICAILFVRFLHQVDHSMGKTILVVEPENNLDCGSVNLKEDREQCSMSWKWNVTSAAGCHRDTEMRSRI